MKKIFVTIVSLFLSTAYTAISYAASSNYEAIYTNSDGSMSIQRPMFTDSTGSGNLRLSSSSDKSGVCKLYGFDNFVEHSASDEASNSTDGEVKNSVVIDGTGKFGGFATDNSIQFLSCRKNGVAVPKYVAARTLVNDDNSVTLVGPSFTINNLANALHTLNDYGTVCKAFGYGSYVNQSIVSKSLCPTCTATLMWSVMLRKDDGTFDSFAPDSSTGASDAIASLICNP